MKIQLLLVEQTIKMIICATFVAMACHAAPASSAVSMDVPNSNFLVEGDSCCLPAGSCAKLCGSGLVCSYVPKTPKGIKIGNSSGVQPKDFETNGKYATLQQPLCLSKKQLPKGRPLGAAKVAQKLAHLLVKSTCNYLAIFKLL